MSTPQPIKVGPLKQSELEEANRIVRMAFGTFLGLPNPLDFMGDRNFMAPRWRSTHVRVIAARSLTLSGSDLFVELGGNSIGEYTTGGATVNAALITGLNNVHQISSFGSDLFVANGNPTNTIGEYTTAGATINSSLITGVDVAHGAASNGSDIFVVNNANGNPGTGFISEYTTSGGLVNGSLITGLSGPEEILILGSNIFVTNFDSGTVGEYTTSGGTVNAALISGLDGALGIATDGTNLYITNAIGGTVSEYTTSGVLVNAALISGLSGPDGIAVVPTDTPEPGSFGLLAVALAGLGFLRRRKGHGRISCA